MGTKRNPGEYDCYANAEPDEPMFILLGRDRHAAALVEQWAVLREREGEDASKVQEAKDCAANMRAWHAKKKGRQPIPICRLPKGECPHLVACDSIDGCVLEQAWRGPENR